jgi:hypothetical protein
MAGLSVCAGARVSRMKYTSIQQGPYKVVCQMEYQQ